MAQNARDFLKGRHEYRFFMIMITVLIWKLECKTVFFNHMKKPQGTVPSYHKQ